MAFGLTLSFNYLPHDCTEAYVADCKAKAAKLSGPPVGSVKYCGCVVIVEIVATIDNPVCIIGTKFDVTYCCLKVEKVPPKIDPSETAARRENFERMKERLKKEWSEEHGCDWPKDDEGNDYDAHHIEPLSRSGDNTLENLVPAPRKWQQKIHEAYRKCYADC